MASLFDARLCAGCGWPVLDCNCIRRAQENDLARLGDVGCPSCDYGLPINCTCDPQMPADE